MSGSINTLAKGTEVSSPHQPGLSAADLSGIASGDCGGASADDLRVAAALRSQLDRVLAELWSFADDNLTFTGDSTAMAQLAMRLCRLYPPSELPVERTTFRTHVLELYAREATVARGRVRLTRLEAALLHYLLSHRERILARDELMRHVWGKHLTGAAARTVDIHVHRLRAKLGPEFAAHIETVRPLGYRFCSEPTPQPAHKKMNHR